MPSETRNSSKKRSLQPETTPQPKPSKAEPPSKRPKPQPATSSAKELNPPTQSLKLHESTGDIFSAPPSSLLIHSCNCEGQWGAGIAKAFKLHYPSAFEIYLQHCKSSTSESLIGTALLIPPSNSTPTPKPRPGPGGAAASRDVKEHFIGCLFTSRSKGKKRDPPARILAATETAMGDLMRQVGEWDRSQRKTGEGDGEEREGEGEAGTKEGERKVGEVRMCKINSGLFNVPWEETRKLLEGLGVEGFGEVEVVSL